jgi:hypothetical protein
MSSTSNNNTALQTISKDLDEFYPGKDT